MKVCKNFDGENLRLARQVAGLTLAELGEKTSASRQYIQKLESDSSANPAGDMLLALAEVLGVEPRFFSSVSYSRVYEDNCHFRKRKTTPKNLQGRAVSYGTMFNIVLGYLEEHVDLPEVFYPSYGCSNIQDIENIAERLRLEWKIGNESPIKNLTNLIEYWGGVVHSFSDVSDKIDAFSYACHNTTSRADSFRPIIVRNTAKASRSRYRFDLAHELGHLIMHRDIDIYDDVAVEREADRFASAFLLPHDAFLKEASWMAKRIDWRQLCELKKRWGVSLQALIRRAFDINLISATQYRSANVYISKKGWRKAEPCEDQIGLETPSVVTNALSLLENHGASLRQVAFDIGVSEGLLTNILNKPLVSA